MPSSWTKSIEEKTREVSTTLDAADFFDFFFELTSSVLRPFDTKKLETNNEKTVSKSFPTLAPVDELAQHSIRGEHHGAHLLACHRTCSVFVQPGKNGTLFIRMSILVNKVEKLHKKAT